MRSSTLLWGLIDFCNKYMSSLWLMLSPWIIRTFPTLPPLLASLIPRTFRRYHTPTIYLPQNNHHTYLSWYFHSHPEIYCHATSTILLLWNIVIPRYIAMQIPPFHYYDKHLHCHIALRDHITDIVFVAQPPFIIIIHVMLASLHILVHCQRHSYRVILF